MITFLLSLIFLVLGYVFYSKIAEKFFRMQPNRLPPAIAAPDGVDRVPMPIWKSTIIELLNIAGTGPIFGAIAGALFGPIAFVWIVAGCILGGAVHDYMSGMISMRHNGESIVSLTKIYLGNALMWIMRIFSLIVMLLVTACFVIAPSNLLETVTIGYIPAYVWLVIILAYYFIATIFPVDKIIGKIYPAFGVLLLLMALSVMGSIFSEVNVHSISMPELWNHCKDYSAINGGVPWWPFMLTTISCGAISGFHATQTPIVSKCVKNEKEGRKVFYGAMVLEGIIALIWAAAAMSYFNLTNSSEEWHHASDLFKNPAQVVYDMCRDLLGPFGVILAVVGVVVCPITTGDTALRSSRLVISEWIHLDQKPIKNRIFTTLPLFGIVIALSLWAFFNRSGFNILWSWFVWANQVFAAISLWVSTSFLLKYGRYRFGSLITALPAAFVTAFVVCFFFADARISLGQLYPSFAIIVGSSIGGASAAAATGFYLYKLIVAPKPKIQPLINFKKMEKPLIKIKKKK